MRVFIYEHLCALDFPPSGSLATEGRAMLQSIVADLGALPGVEPVVLAHPTHWPALHEAAPGAELHPSGRERKETVFRTLAGGCEFALVIAPEFEDRLLTCCEWAREAGARLLNPPPSLVELASDKLTLADHLLRHGLPTPPTLPFTETLPGWPFPVVVKPRFGAGSQSTFLVRDRNELHDAPRAARADGWTGELIVQPFIPGQAVSKSVLAGPDVLEILPGCEQHLSDDGRFRYQGGALPLPEDLDERASDLVLGACRTLPGLAGYAGFDLVVGEAGDWIIELNPRLTTSYIGLRALANFNLAQALLSAVQGEPLPQLTWGAGPVTFKVDGTCPHPQYPKGSA